MGPIGRALAGIALDADLPLGSDRGADRAARVEVTAGRRVVRIGRVAELEVGRVRRSTAEPRHGGEQRLRVRDAAVPTTTASVGPTSTIRPRYMTASVSLT